MSISPFTTLLVSGLALLSSSLTYAADKTGQGSGTNTTSGMQPEPVLKKSLLPDERKRIPSHNPDWSNNNEPGPGVTRQLPVDRQAGEIRFGDGASGRRPTSNQEQTPSYQHGGGQTPSGIDKRQSFQLKQAPRLNTVPMKNPPSNIQMQRENKSQTDEDKLEQKEQERMHQIADESVEEEKNSEKEVKEQMEKALKIIKESREMRQETVRETISTD